MPKPNATLPQDKRWVLEETGGGHTAWIRYLEGSGRSVSWYITAGDGEAPDPKHAGLVDLWLDYQGSILLRAKQLKIAAAIQLADRFEYHG